MLKLMLDGLWKDNKGFVAAIMLKWNTDEDANGRKHYVFLASPFNAIPHDIVSNGEDDSVLLSEDMYKVLLNKGVIRPITADEAEEANDNAEVIEQNKISAASHAETDKKLKIERDKPASTKNSSEQAKPVPLKTAGEQPLTQVQKDVIADITVSEKTSSASAEKKGGK